MLKLIRRGATAFETIVAPGADWRLAENAVWIELIDPTRQEELAVEAALGLQLPTREEMNEIEVSSRLYQEDGAVFLTATVLTKSDSDMPAAAPITFVLTGQRLVTIRYVEPRAFAAFSAQAERQPNLCTSGAQVLLGLLDAIVDRTADILEHAAAEVETASRAIFRQPRSGGFEPILTQLGRSQVVTAKARDSLVSLARLISYVTLADQMEADPDFRSHLKSLQRDAQALTDHAGYLSGNITFLLDAALGLINIEQNAIIKIFSVASVVFLPPTLVASVYGMNFEHMPELKWLHGYPIALALMVLSMLVPLWWFRKKGWL
jgi:magnesium transporter